VKRLHPHRIRPSWRQPGFTLAELAIVLVIVSLLLGGTMAMVSAQTEQRNWNDTQSRLEAARDAILGYAIANGRLPCPAMYQDATSVGTEVRQASGVCGIAGDNTYDYYGGVIAPITYGLLPAVTIGYQPVDTQGFAQDAWGNRIRYAVSRRTAPMTTSDNFTNKATLITNYRANISISGPVLPDDLIVCASATGIVAGPPGGCGAAANQVTGTTTVVAIIYSPGKNGRSPAALGADEAANENRAATNDAVFVSHTPAPAGATGGEFDDQVLWISVGTLYSKLIAAGVLP